jgi:acetyltransferase-like isoleucine patch superfamily enzyme
LKYLGKKVLIDEGAYMLNPENISLDDNTWIDKNVILIAGDPTKTLVGRKYFMRENKSYKGKLGELKIGKNCHIAPNVVIQAHGGVEIGDCTGVASGAKIYSMSHHYRNLQTDDGILYKFTPRAPADQQLGAVVMEENTALGLNSVILPGVTIGKNSWVGISSYVTSDIPPNSIASGCPAKVIKERQIPK